MAEANEFTLMRRGMDALGMAVFWARPEDGGIVYGNRAALALFNCTEQELPGDVPVDVEKLR